MELVTQIFLLLAGLIVTSQSLPEDDKTTKPDPSIFETETPPNFMKFFSMKDDKSENPVKFHYWSADNVLKFPDWFHFTDSKPEKEIKVEKEAEKDEKETKKSEKKDYPSWLDSLGYVGLLGGNKFDDKDVFSSYNNVFPSNAYPSWMVMPSFFNNGPNEAKGKKDETLQAQNVAEVAKPEKKADVKGASIDSAKLVKKDKGSDDIEVKKPSKSEDLKISKHIGDTENEKLDPHPRPFVLPIHIEDVEAEIKKVPTEVVKETKEDPPINNVSDVEPKVKPEPVVPEKVPESKLDISQSKDTSPVVPIVAIDANKDEAVLAAPNKEPASKTPSMLEAKSDAVPEPTVHEDKLSSDEEWKTLLLQLLQHAKPIFESMNSKETSVSNSPKPAMIPPVKENHKPKGRSLLSGDDGVVNNAEPPKLEKNMNRQLLTNVNSPNNGVMPNRPQNSNGQNQGISNNVPMNMNQGVIPPQSLPNNMAANQGNNMPVNFAPGNQNNYQNQGQPMYLVPYNPNYSMNGHGNQNGQALPNNNMLLVSPGTYPGYNNMPPQNLYAIVPVGNGNGNANPGPNYLNNQQMNQPYQVMGSVPMYNLVPVKNNGVANTKDEEE